MQDEPENSTASDPDGGAPRSIAAAAPPAAEAVLAPQANGGGPEVGGEPELTPGPTGGTVAAPAYVYAIGRIEPRFPTMSVEKEFAQAPAGTDTGGLTDRQALHAVLYERKNRYLARQLCWVLTIEGLDTYILHPRDPGDLDLQIEALRSLPRPTDVDVVIGVQGPIAPPEMCNGLMVPIVVFDQQS